MGEKLLEALIPPHPVKSSPAIGRTASQNIFRSNLTSVEYMYKVILKATTNFGGSPSDSKGFVTSGVRVPAPAPENASPIGRVPSPGAPFNKRDRFPGKRNVRPARPILSIGLLLPLLLGALEQTDSLAKESPAARTEHTLFEAQARFNKNNKDPELAWQFARACFDWADLAPGSERSDIAQRGITASRRAIELAPRLAAAHYYLGLNLGQLARTKKIGAFKLINEMEAEFKAAIALDPKFDYAGAHRSLGLLYLEAPGWPTSIGSRDKARLHLRKAVELSPDFPDNWLTLLEAYLKWDEKSAVQAQLAPTAKMLQEARKTLTGDNWELSWQDWDRRWARIKAKASENPAKLESPRQRK